MKKLQIEIMNQDLVIYILMNLPYKYNTLVEAVEEDLNAIADKSKCLNLVVGLPWSHNQFNGNTTFMHLNENRSFNGVTGIWTTHVLTVKSLGSFQQGKTHSSIEMGYT
jgi:hypothetical protein